MKRHIIYKAVCILIMMLCCVGVKAQEGFGKVSPQTADFIRHGNIPVSLYTGQVNISIPLYHIKDKDFDIPIVLNYANDGLRPNRRHGWAGLGWSVSGAGAVSREIYGAPDDHSEWYTPSAQMGTKGYYLASQTRYYDADALYDFDITMNCESYGCDLPHIDNCFYDGLPDLFLFSVPGHSGRFLPYGFYKLGEFICPNRYKYTLKEFATQTRGTSPAPSQITVTSSDGYIYTFGSTVGTHTLEYSISFHPEEQYELEDMQPRINAWHLTKIEAPNGRTVTFTYAFTRAVENTLSPFMKSDCSRTPAGDNTADITDDFTYSATRNVLLKSIYIEDIGLEVEFINSLETCREFYSYGVTQNKYNALGYQLDGIRVKQDDEVVYSCSLNYENKGHLRFLSKVTATDGGVYTLEYNHPSSYPEPTTEDTDTYGYWKGTGSTAYSLLSKIIYPTGGSTSFGYERHTYNRAVRRTATESAYTCNLVDSVGTLNAFRIKRITSTPSDGSVFESKEYAYPLWSDSDKDSGTLLRTRTFVYLDNYQVSQTADRNDDYNVEEPIIGYTSVQEKNADGSYTEYIFSDYQTCPDTSDSNFHWANGTECSGIMKAFSTASLQTSQWSRRGFLTSRKECDSDGNRIRYTRYCYRQLGNTIQPADMELQSHDSPYTTLISPITGGMVATKLVMQEYPLIQTETTDYRSGKGVTETERFYHNTLNQLSRQERNNSTGDTLKTHYTYFNEVSTALLYNLVDLPASERSSLNSSDLGERRIVYKDLIGCGTVVDTVYLRKGTEAERMEVCYPVYDSSANPVYAVYGDGRQEVLVWGHGNRYLLARIEGVGYDDVKTALGVAPESAGSEANVKELLDGLRTSLPSALVTTYTYTPSVGVTSMTAPNGEVTTYTYDALNRLHQVKDHNGKVVEEYEYNYQQ